MEVHQDSSSFVKIVVSNLSLEDDEYEVRVLIETATGENIGMASTGGFTSKGFKFSKLDKNARLSIDITHLASGIYYARVQIIRNSDKKTTVDIRSESFEYISPTLSGEAYNLHYTWGFGYTRFPIVIDTAD